MYQLIIWLALLCNFHCAKDFQIIDATSQRWAGGIKSSGTGINYKITIRTETSSDVLNIDQLWIGKDFYSIKAGKAFPSLPSDGYSKFDTAFINVTERYLSGENDNVKKILKDEQISPPVEYQGVALIGFAIKNKRKYKTVESFRKLEDLYYP